jgi:hypothetical protein
MQVDDACKVRALQERLLARPQLRNARGLGVIQVEELAGAVNIQVGIRQEELRGAALDDGAKQIRRGEVLGALRRQQHRRVPLAPGLQGLGDIRFDGGVRDEAPGFIEHEQLECLRRAILNRGACAVEHIEQERLQDEWILFETLKVKALDAL